MRLGFIFVTSILDQKKKVKAGIADYSGTSDNDLIMLHTVENIAHSTSKSRLEIY